MKLRGHHPTARDRMWTATAFLMSSRNEGYPLASLESMARGCPVISYDIKYGPREQITEGVDGFLVEPGDIEGLAERMVRDDPRPGTRRADEPGSPDQGSAARLRHVPRRLEEVSSSRPSRTRRTAPVWTRSSSNSGSAGTSRTSPCWSAVSRRLPRSTAQVGRCMQASSRRPPVSKRSPQFRLAGSLRLLGRGVHRTLDAVVMTLEAVCDETAQVVSLPLAFRPQQATIRIRDHVRCLRQSLGNSAEESTRSGCVCVWCGRTRSGRQRVRRAEALAPFETSFAADGQLLLHGSGATT